MSDQPLVLFATLPDTLSAHAVAERLRLEGVPAEIRDAPAMLGEARQCRVLVPKNLEHRAKWIFSSENISESELTFLATGELGEAKDNGSGTE